MYVYSLLNIAGMLFKFIYIYCITNYHNSITSYTVYTLMTLCITAQTFKDPLQHINKMSSQVSQRITVRYAIKQGFLGALFAPQNVFKIHAQKIDKKIEPQTHMRG